MRRCRVVTGSAGQGADPKTARCRASPRPLRSAAMKRLHRPDLYGWSRFDEARDIDFHSVLWVRPEGSVVVDPLPLSRHDQGHLAALGPVAWIVVTNSDHLRSARELAVITGAKIAGPRAEELTFSPRLDRHLGDGESLVLGLVAFELHGSKTPGELALVLDRTTLVTGDLVRAHSGGALCLLPDDKLTDKEAALASVARLAMLPHLEAVLVGDGWPIFRDGAERLRELVVAEGA